jgi:hypothetical protein
VEDYADDFVELEDQKLIEKTEREKIPEEDSNIPEHIDIQAVVDSKRTVIKKEKIKGSKKGAAVGPK